MNMDVLFIIAILATPVLAAIALIVMTVRKKADQFDKDYEDDLYGLGDLDAWVEEDE